MIRRAIIGLLCCAAAAMMALWVVSLLHPIRFHVLATKTRHACVELRNGNCYAHYIFSHLPDLLRTLDELEDGMGQSLTVQRMFAVQRDVDRIDWYAWSYRFDLPLWDIAIALGVYPAFAFVRGPVRRWQRKRKALCVDCGYDLTGNVSGVCPECGTKVEDRSARIEEGGPG